MESWDDDNFEPQVAQPGLTAANKWEGEDEDDNVKESWEDEEEEQQKPEEKTIVESKPKPKKLLQEKIAEKERRRKEELEKRLQDEQEEDISEEEKLKRQVESDLKLALETTFGGTGTPITGLDGFNPNTKEEFDEFAGALEKKLQPLSQSAEYPAFSENVIRSLCAPLSSFDLKKIKVTIENLYLEKQKLEKGDKIKKSKGKGKVKIKVEDENQYSAYVGDYNDYDDFM